MPASLAPEAMSQVVSGRRIIRAEALDQHHHVEFDAIRQRWHTALWLGETPAKPETLHELLRPYSADEMEVWPMSTRVNSIRNDQADLFERV